MKKILSVILALVSLFSIAILPLSAADGAVTVTKEIGQTTAYEDLSSAKQNGLPIDMLLKYPKNPAASSKEAAFITFVEVGYKQHGIASQMSDYALYCYVYYPRGTYPLLDTDLHEITLATSFERKDVNDENGVLLENQKDWRVSEDGGYKSFKMTLVNFDDDSVTGYDVFPVMKFKIDVTPGELDNVAEDGSRRYDVGEFEIHFRDNTEAKSSAVGRSIICSGYRKGDGADSTKDTFSMTTSNIDVVPIKVQQTHFRYANKADEHLKTQLNSVYFAVDREFYEKWDDIVSIRAEWFEAHSTPIVVTSDEALYKEYMGLESKYYDQPVKYIGANIGRLDYKDKLPERSIGIYQNYPPDDAKDYWAYIWQYNTLGKNAVREENVYTKLGGDCNRLSWFFKYPHDAGTVNVAWQQSLQDASISSEQLYNYYKEYLISNDFLTKDGFKGAAFMHAVVTSGLAATGKGAVDEGRTWGWQVHDLGGTLDIDGMDYTSSIEKWFSQLIDGYRDVEDLTGIEVIEPINNADFVTTPLDDESLCRKYYVAKEDVDKFRSYCEKAINNDQVVICFRFAVTDYYSAPLTIRTDGNFGVGATYEGLAYVAQETIFFNFDVLSFTCNKDGVNTVVPVAMDPAFIAGDVNAPDDMPPPPKPELEFPWWILGLVGLVVVVIMLINPAMTVVGAVGKGVGAVGKAVGKGVGAVGKAVGKGVGAVGKGASSAVKKARRAFKSKNQKYKKRKTKEAARYTDGKKGKPSQKYKPKNKKYTKRKRRK